MKIDYLVIGQGISGTWLSYYLHQLGQSFMVIDDQQLNAASRRAAGLINPITGRRHVRVWMSENVLPHAWAAYNEIGEKLSLSCISKASLVDFFPTAQMRLSFSQRCQEGESFLQLGKDENKYRPSFNYEFGFGTIDPVYIVDVQRLSDRWRRFLEANSLIMKRHFDPTALQVNNHKVSYEEIDAKKIIFCDGNSSMNYSWFKSLPFTPNKGEFITVDIPGLAQDKVYKKGMMMVPFNSSGPGHWWIGSNYQWEFDHDKPTDKFLRTTTTWLNSWLNLPFTVLSHSAAIRPATLERRPFVGIHPHYPAIGILNGMGTKGCSLAPYFAQQLAGHLVNNDPIEPAADIKRFERLLATN
jgi:glycine/D-amino acid oxidase-like deaminating enzyme